MSLSDHFFSSEECYNDRSAEYVHHAWTDRFIDSLESGLTKEYAKRDGQCRPDNKHPEIKSNHLGCRSTPARKHKGGYP